MARRLACLGLALALLAGGCAYPTRTPVRPVHHVVLTWLKEPGSPEGREKLIRASQSLMRIPGVVAVKPGTVVPSDREIVDDSFDVAVLVTFENQAALAAYVGNPVHQAAVREVLAPLASKVVIYDFIEEFVEPERSHVAGQGRFSRR